MSVFEDLSHAATSALEAVAPSVVRIGRNGGRGCGVVVGDGLVATNAHNLRGDETLVTFADGRQDVATVAGIDIDGDLAVVRVDTGGVPAVTWSSEPASTGDVVFAVSRALGGGERVSFGMVSGTERAFRGPRGRRIKGSLEHTAPLPRGSSGGPVVSLGGTVIGLNTNRLGDGFYLAIPADQELQDRVAALTAGQARTRRRLGVGLAPAHVSRALRRSVGLDERDGLLVRVVEDDSAAAAAGIRQGDLLVSINGQPLSNADDLFDALDGAPGEVRVGIVRGTEELEVTVQFPSGQS
ncbi:MAG TPA: trypsin-like peptidase domain-containing protein [Acidimicrobiales bacterium]|jgi:S1-C subfamily serine protease|nr:trypsin-like peptidase domain-containing protein [Acidimicrobiales bacterium]